MQVVLRIVNNKSNVRQLRLTSPTTTIGRSADCQLKVDSDKISRRHCQIVVHDNWVSIKDLGSSNGTFVNGQQIPAEVELPLSPGTLVSMGSLQFSVEYQLPAPTPGLAKPATLQSGTASSNSAAGQGFDAEATQPMKTVRADDATSEAQKPRRTTAERIQAMTLVDSPRPADATINNDTLATQATAVPPHKTEPQLAIASLAAATSPRDVSSQEIGESRVVATSQAVMAAFTVSETDVGVSTKLGDTTNVQNEIQFATSAANSTSLSEATHCAPDVGAVVNSEPRLNNDSSDCVPIRHLGEQPVVPVKTPGELTTDGFQPVDELQFQEMFSQLESISADSDGLTTSQELDSETTESVLDQLSDVVNNQATTTLANPAGMSGVLTNATTVSEHSATIAAPTATNDAKDVDASFLAAAMDGQTAGSTVAEISALSEVTGTTLRPLAAAPVTVDQATSLPAKPAAMAMRSVRPKLVQVLDVNKSQQASAASSSSTKLPSSSNSSASIPTSALRIDLQTPSGKLERNGDKAVAQERTSPIPQFGHLLGIDHHVNRTGFAICNSDQTIASLIESDKQHETVDVKRVLRLISEHNIVGLVVSLPVSKPGVESPKSVDCRKFAEWLSQVTPLPVTFADERSSSRFAAQVMLQGYLEVRRTEKSKSATSSRMLTEC